MFHVRKRGRSLVVVVIVAVESVLDGRGGRVFGLHPLVEQNIRPRQLNVTSISQYSAFLDCRRPGAQRRHKQVPTSRRVVAHRTK